MAEVAIIGAGIKGLTKAYRQQLLGHKCTVLEKTNRIGGAIRSTHHDSGYSTEDSAHSILINSSALEAFILSFKSSKSSLIESNPKAQNRFILKNDRLYPIQPKPSALLSTQLLPITSRMKLFTEWLKKPIHRSEDISLNDFFIEHFGKAFADYLLNPFIAGTYAGDPSKLSAASTFPKLLEYERTYGSILKGLTFNRPQVKSKIISFKEGLSNLTDSIAQALENKPLLNCNIIAVKQVDRQWEIQYQIANTQIVTKKFDKVHCTVPAFAISRIPFEASVKNDLPNFESVEHPPVSVLSLGFRKSDISHPMNGLGYLSPKVEGTNHLGALFVSQMFPNRAPKDHELISFFIGGSRNPELADPDSDKLIHNLAPALSKILGIRAKPSFSYQRYWAESIPQYTIGHRDFIESIDCFEKKYPNFIFEGNYRNGISLNQSLL